VRSLGSTFTHRLEAEEPRDKRTSLRKMRSSTLQSDTESNNHGNNRKCFAGTEYVPKFGRSDI
jgi:hypothetical protein